MEREKTSWHSMGIDDVFNALHTSQKGLLSQNVDERLKKYGHNELEEKEKKSPIALFFGQFNNFIIWILVGVTIISLLLTHYFEAALVFIILILNACVGFWQEFKAEKSIEALRKLAALKAKVIRDGRQVKINAQDLVPGDIILLETGDKVPADARLIEAVRIEVDESSLTGESTTVKKEVKSVKKDTPLAERFSILYSSTVIASGRGKAVVVETGMNTEIGNIANLVQKAEKKETPLQHKLSQLGEYLGVGTLVICAVVFFVIYLKGFGLVESFKQAISLAVAAIPEGLAAVVTVCLALGVQRMVKKNALVRVLPAVETLGSTNVICTDKTGTLTYNQMTVREIFVNGAMVDVTGHGYVPEGVFEQNNKKTDPKKLELILKIGTLCNDAKLAFEDKKWNIFGDPTEAALVVAAKKAGVDQDDINKSMPRIDELPFDSSRKLMTTIHKSNDKRLAYVKGAPDIIIEKCNRININGTVRKITPNDKKDILEHNLGMANKALRVLGFAYREISNKEKKIEEELIFVGLMGMIDPPRQEVIESIRKCKEAGIKVVMITGDHKATAVAIGKELGLAIGKVMTGPELEETHTLADDVEDVSIYARVSPQHKMRIVGALKSKNYVVAMTGDGVNDAPALKMADIGISMGITGTDVAKEASDMILTDDNFASIVNAVEEGRGIYDNIKKFVKYLLSSNIGEVMTMIVAALIGFSILTDDGPLIIMPLMAVHLLWINLLTDSFPALALGVEPTDPDVMKQSPRKQSEPIISKNYALDMIFIGAIMALGTLFVFNLSLKAFPENPVYATTMAFSTLVLFQLFNVLNCKSDNKSLFTVGILNNKWLIRAILFSLFLQIVVVYAPAVYGLIDQAMVLPGAMEGFNLSEKLGTTPLNPFDWLIVFVVGSTIVVFEEIRKFISRRMSYGRT